MTTNVKVFCDTNILIRLNVAETREHLQVKQAVSTLITNHNALWINRQVLREFCSVLTRPQAFPIPPTPAEVALRARTLAGLFFVADEDARVTDRLLTLLETIPMGGKQVHDANIVATMQVYGIQHLFTLNPVDFSRFAPPLAILTPTDLLTT